jgi:membrane protease YdiL (CAAX protease family)
MRSSTTPQRPGWPEMLVGAVAYAAAFLATIVVLRLVPEEQPVLAGHAALALSGVMGLVAFAAAVAIRIRRVDVFGIRTTSWRWLLAGAGLGVVCFILGIVVSVVYIAVSGDAQNVQGDYQSAAAGGILAYLATLLLGSVVTPIGEEFLFRGVLFTALQRYGAWAAVIASAAVFALAHGINPVLPVAFVVGVVTALLFRRTRSVWPGVVVHGVNNALAATAPLLLAAVVPSGTMAA